MKKNELNKLRRLPATPAMIYMAKMPGKKVRRYRGGLNKRRYAYVCRCQNLGKYLKIAICRSDDVKKGITEPAWDVFIDFKDGAYITRERQKDGSYKWRTARIDNLDDENRWNLYYDSDEMYYLNPAGKAEIKALLKTEKTGIEGVIEWQKKIRSDK